MAGILIPVFSIRGEHDLGIGDVASLSEFVRLASEVEFSFVQLLPITETGPDNSPYNAISSVAIDPLTIHCRPEALPDLDEPMFEATLSKFDLEMLNSGPVQYAEVRRLKHELLHAAYDRFMTNTYGQVDLRADEFERFCASEASWLNDYCVFRFLMDEEGGSQVWSEWREEFQTYEGAVAFLQARAESDAAAIDRSLRYYAYVQWIAYQQWHEVVEDAANRGILLMGDIPFGVSLYSVDVWADREIFDLDWYGGAPPEELFKDDEFVQKWGQNWGIPLYNWEALEGRGYDWWRRRIEKTTEIFRLFRVDHALGFYRIYSFPWNPVRNEEFLPLSADEAAERCGGRLPGFRARPDGTAEEKQANCDDGERYLSMLKEAAGKAEVIAEDLGTVPDYVRPSLEKLGIAGMKVPQWEFDDWRVTSGLKYPRLSFATYATHDHAPMQVQWNEALAAMSTNQPESEDWIEARDFLGALSGFAGLEFNEMAIREYSDEIWDALFRQLSLSNSDRIAVMVSD
ncbi:MAG: 4-alpha-glucanotransferase, partial [Verrucomicrobiota bacterium]